MKAYVYILKSESGKYYIGSTTDLSRRLKQHNSGHTYTTKRLRGCTIVFKQEYKNLFEARRIERKLKSWKRKDYFEKIIQDGVIKTGV